VNFFKSVVCSIVAIFSIYTSSILSADTITSSEVKTCESHLSSLVTSDRILTFKNEKAYRRYLKALVKQAKRISERRDPSRGDISLEELLKEAFPLSTLQNPNSKHVPVYKKTKLARFLIFSYFGIVATFSISATITAMLESDQAREIAQIITLSGLFGIFSNAFPTMWAAEYLESTSTRDKKRAKDIIKYKRLFSVEAAQFVKDFLGLVQDNDTGLPTESFKSEWKQALSAEGLIKPDTLNSHNFSEACNNYENKYAEYLLSLDYLHTSQLVNQASLSNISAQLTTHYNDFQQMPLFERYRSSPESMSAEDKIEIIEELRKHRAFLVKTAPILNVFSLMKEKYKNRIQSQGSSQLEALLLFASATTHKDWQDGERDYLFDYFEHAEKENLTMNAHVENNTKGMLALTLQYLSASGEVIASQVFSSTLRINLMDADSLIQLGRALQEEAAQELLQDMILGMKEMLFDTEGLAEPPMVELNPAEQPSVELKLPGNSELLGWQLIRAGESSESSEADADLWEFE